MSAMLAGSASLPPLLAYPERRWPRQGPVERAGIVVAAALLAHATRARAARLAPILTAVERHADTMRGLSDMALRDWAREAGAALRSDPARSVETVARVLAPVCEAASRVLGQRPFPPQVARGVCLHPRHDGGDGDR